MQKGMRWLITLSLLGAALLCYAMGSEAGAVSLLILGAVFEGAFWWRLCSGRRSAPRADGKR
ncbi:hypothetical protein [Ferrimonas pelagia]